jgi:hypothetical protein
MPGPCAGDAGENEEKKYSRIYVQKLLKISSIL